MVQMDIELFVLIRAIRELISKVLSEKNYITCHMINNVRICARKNMLELESADIKIDPKTFDTSFITTYRGTSNNYTESKFLIVVLFHLFS